MELLGAYDGTGSDSLGSQKEILALSGTTKIFGSQRDDVVALKNDFGRLLRIASTQEFDDRLAGIEGRKDAQSNTDAEIKDNLFGLSSDLQQALSDANSAMSKLGISSGGENNQFDKDIESVNTLIAKIKSYENALDEFIVNQGKWADDVNEVTSFTQAYRYPNSTAMLDKMDLDPMYKRSIYERGGFAFKFNPVHDPNFREKIDAQIIRSVEAEGVSSSDDVYRIKYLDPAAEIIKKEAINSVTAEVQETLAEFVDSISKGKQGDFANLEEDLKGIVKKTKGVYKTRSEFVLGAKNARGYQEALNTGIESAVKEKINAAVKIETEIVGLNWRIAGVKGKIESPAFNASTDRQSIIDKLNTISSDIDRLEDTDLAEQKKDLNLKWGEYCMPWWLGGYCFSFSDKFLKSQKDEVDGLSEVCEKKISA